jgi:hypothetical protein
MLKASVVDSVTSTSPLSDPSKLGGPGDAAGRPFIDALACRKSVEQPFLVLLLGAAEEMAEGGEHGAHNPAGRWRQRREIGPRRRGQAKHGRDVLGGIGRPVFGTPRKLAADGPPPLPATSAHISSRLASSIC